MTNEMKSTDQYFLAILFIVLYMLIPTLDSVLEIYA